MSKRKPPNGPLHVRVPREAQKEFEERRQRITKAIMKRYFADAFKDIGQLILDVEAIVETELDLQSPKDKQ
jgi:hypothetical protein